MDLLGWAGWGFSLGSHKRKIGTIPFPSNFCGQLFLMEEVEGKQITIEPTYRMAPEKEEKFDAISVL